MKTLQKLGAVTGAVIVSVILTRIIMQWIFTHNQGIFSLKNFIFALIFPVILVIAERNSTFTILVWKSAAFAVALTLIDYLLARYADWGGMIW